jgi:hypothetical protein
VKFFVKVNFLTNKVVFVIKKKIQVQKVVFCAFFSFFKARKKPRERKEFSKNHLLRQFAKVNLGMTRQQ